MGVLDELIGGLAGGAMNGGGLGGGRGGQADLLRIVLSMLASGGSRGAAPAGGAPDLGGLLGSVLGGALGGGRAAAPADTGGIGGLNDLLERFQQAGLGGKVDSWIGTGPNEPISGDQLGQALGVDAIDSIAAQLGTSRGEAAGQLSELLPQVLDKLTPHGRVPEGGLGGVEDLLGALMRR